MSRIKEFESSLKIFSPDFREKVFLFIIFLADKKLEKS